MTNKEKLHNRLILKLFNTYKASAKKRNYQFYLDVHQFEILTQGNCYYCGIEPIRIKTLKSPKLGSYLLEWNGIDRVDNNKDYSEGNVVTCCYFCNKAKSSMNCTEFHFFLWKITKHKIETHFGKEAWQEVYNKKPLDGVEFEGVAGIQEYNFNA